MRTRMQKFVPDEISTAAATMGRKGGASKSQAKTAAVRENGRKGGRPRTVKYTGRINDDGIWLDAVCCPYCGSTKTSGADNVDSWGTQPQWCSQCERKFVAVQSE